MKAQWSLAALVLLTATSLAHAGGPPPMYVVVDKVVLEPGKRVPQWIQIWGCVTRLERGVDKSGKETLTYSKPTYGYLYLTLPRDNDKLNEDLQDWQRAAGTGKAVAVGSCGDAGTLLKCRIHQPKEKDSQPDATYTTGHLRLFGDLYASTNLDHYPEVKALLKFAGERK